MDDSAWSVEAAGLTKRYGERTAVAGLDLRVRRGEFFGFLGPNGAGKTTTIKMLCGMLRPTSGTARVAGLDVLRDPLGVKARVGILPEELNTYERLTAAELLAFSGLMHGIEEAEVRRRAADLLELVDLAGEADRLVIDYSMGMKKKVALACALIHAPTVLFLDEPFNGVDAISGQALRNALKALAGRGVTVFFSSHVLEVVEKLCTDMGIIEGGRLVARGDLAALRDQSGAGPTATLTDVFVKLCGREEHEARLDWIR